MKTIEKIHDGFEHVYYERIETRANIIVRLKPFECHKDTTVGIEKGTDREYSKACKYRFRRWKRL